PDVGGKVREREVRLVADGRDDGRARGRDGAHDDLVVERPQVLRAAAAAAHDDDVAVGRGEAADRVRDVIRRAVALHARAAHEQTGLMSRATICTLLRAPYTVTRPRTSTSRPSSGRNFMWRLSPANMTAFSRAPSSFTSKYQWPDEASLKPETSPRTHTSIK